MQRKVKPRVVHKAKDKSVNKSPENDKALYFNSLLSPFFPIYGGEGEDEDEGDGGHENDSNSSHQGTSQNDSSTKESSSSEEVGDGTKDLSPQQISDLLSQVNELTSKVTNLTQENNTYKSKEQQAQRAAQSREETLEQDLVEAQKTVTKMDQVLRQQAIINAIQGNKDLEFHSAKHVVRELDENGYDVDVDLDNGTATVTGIENELKRIARECDWLVKKNNQQSNDQGGPRTPRPRSSGNPPAAVGNSGDKQTKRSALVEKFPVITHGRSAMR